ncbi:MAG: helix-turn-helix domain-containing protein [Oscillospiraceae bacterium]|nr:helix-turn-helix domain-containing protein [Oscillospiraceae bacterium]
MYCDNEKVVKYGTNPKGKQRFKCGGCKKTFQLEYSNNAARLDTKLLIIKMSLNGSGVRNISRALGVSTNTVSDVFKKAATVSPGLL